MCSFWQENSIKFKSLFWCKTNKMFSESKSLYIEKRPTKSFAFIYFFLNLSLEVLIKVLIAGEEWILSFLKELSKFIEM